MITDAAAEADPKPAEGEWFLEFPDVGMRLPAKVTQYVARFVAEAEVDRMCELPPHAAFTIWRGDDEIFSSELSRTHPTALRWFPNGPKDIISVEARLDS